MAWTHENRLNAISQGIDEEEDGPDPNRCTEEKPKPKQPFKSVSNHPKANQLTPFMMETL
jgi:hypothetical protein